MSLIPNILIRQLPEGSGAVEGGGGDGGRREILGHFILKNIIVGFLNYVERLFGPVNPNAPRRLDSAPVNSGIRAGS